MTPPARTHLLFIRTPAHPLEQDPYHSRASSSSCFTPHHLPILQTTYHNSPRLHQILQRPQNYDGVIITSARSAQALAKAQASLTNEAQAEQGWFHHVPIFVVGQGTADALRAHLPRPPPKENVLGADGTTGSGEKLANVIQRHFIGDPRTKPEGKKWSMLYFVGDKNRDTIPSMLEKEDGRFELERFKVYETTALQGDQLEKEVDGNLKQVVGMDHDTRGEGKRLWLIFFSPSGAKAACQEFRRRGWIPDIDKKDLDLGLQIRIAAIGPVTSAYLQDDEGVKVDAEAQTPDAEDLLRCIREVEDKEQAYGEE